MGNQINDTQKLVYSTYSILNVELQLPQAYFMKAQYVMIYHPKIYNLAFFRILTKYFVIFDAFSLKLLFWALTVT